MIKEEIDLALNQAVAKNYLYHFDEFYTLQNEPALVEKRRKGNERAGQLLLVAYRIGALLYKFPFVRGIGISGSLSKNYADEDADIDFFIITQSDKLWIARTLLHLLKKLSFLAGKEHWYCMNYFIDEDAMEIAEKNIFTATEVVTLKGVCGDEALTKFFTTNNWVTDYLPNREAYASNNNRFVKNPWYKKSLEYLFNNRFGVWLDNYLMQVTKKRWIQKEVNHKVNSKGEPVGLTIGKHVARPNPEHLQKKLLGMLEEKKSAMEKQWDIQF
jgi:hypothetical protein